MANYHRNHLVIAADEENMLKVLRRFARNIDQAKIDPEFSYEEAASLESVTDLYWEIQKFMENRYMDSLNPTQNDDEDAEAQSEVLNLGGVRIVMSTASSGRGLSEAATLKMQSCGEYWVLIVYYDTANVANHDDVDAFIKSLPDGEYGIAFYDADEFDGYDMTTTYAALHKGGTGFDEAERIVGDSCCTHGKLMEERSANRHVDRGALDDVAEVARVSATRSWLESVWFYGDGEEDEDDEYFADNDGSTLNAWDRPDVNWNNPKSDDFKKIDRYIPQALAAFPWVHRIDRSFTTEGNDAAEGLLPGDRVIVCSDWETGNGQPNIHICNMAGTKMGSFAQHSARITGDWQVARSSLALLGCILPHLHATVNSLEPVSLRSKGVEEPKLGVRFELEPIDIDVVIQEVHKLLEKKPAERALQSIVDAGEAF